MSSGVSATWLSAAQRAEAEGLVAYINASPSPFHAVEAAKALLVGAGFAPLSERAEWDVQPNGKYFVTRNNSTLVAFAVGGKWVRGSCLLPSIIILTRLAAETRQCGHHDWRAHR